jgi:Cu+-exporting ATPase
MHHSSDEGSKSSDETSRAVDPICGMTVDKSSAAATATHDGVVYYFCSDGCAATFSANPSAAK